MLKIFEANIYSKRRKTPTLHISLVASTVADAVRDAVRIAKRTSEIQDLGPFLVTVHETRRTFL